MLRISESQNVLRLFDKLYNLIDFNLNGNAKIPLKDTKYQFFIRIKEYTNNNCFVETLPLRVY